MTNVHLIRAQWSGFTGAPGVTTMGVIASTDTAVKASVDALSAAFSLMTGELPSSVSIAFPGQGDVYEIEGGTLQDEYSVLDGAGRQGTAAGAYAAGAGASIRWGTNQIVNGHRLYGRTFIVPLSASAYESNGTLTAVAMAGIQNGVDSLVNYNASAADGRFIVWSRPRKASEGVTARAGGFAYITSGVVKDQVHILRSRRD